MKVRELQAELMAFDPEEEIFNISDVYNFHEVTRIERNFLGQIVID